MPTAHSYPRSPVVPATIAPAHLVPTWANLRVAAIMLAASWLVSACAVPDADRAIADSTSPVSSASPQIEGVAGPLTTAQSKALLAKIDAGADGDVLRRHLAIEEAVAGSPLTASNSVAVLRDGPETFKAIATAIREAQHTLDLEYYTIEDVTFEDDAGGTTLLALLLEKRREGVEVNILYDSYGSSDTPAEFFDALEQAGVKLLEYHPIAPIDPTNMLTVNLRDHRKILVADGAIGVVGGVNLSKDYQSKAPGTEDGAEDARAANAAPADNDNSEAPAGNAAIDTTTDVRQEWRDTAIQIEGPAVGELQALFREHWAAEDGPPLRTTLAAESTVKGTQVVRIIGSTPDDKVPSYYVTLISALRSAETRAWVSTAYFVPTPEQMDELTAAAKRGIDVRLLLAGSSDSDISIEAAHTHFSDLLRAGVKIYETNDVVLHSKTVTIDGVWSAVGSSNFDFRSVIYNDEVDAIVIGAETATELEKVFEEGIKLSTQIDGETWEENRPVGERMKGFFSRMWENLL